MTNRSDLFDEPEEPRAQPPPPQESSETPAQAAPETQPQPQAPSGAFSRRNFLRGAGAAAVAGAVVGAGAAVGLGATDGDGGGGVVERDGMTLGAPPNKVVEEAVIKLKVNGVDRWLGVASNESLAEVLRRKLGLTGTKIGCDRSECSACTVILNGKAVNSCSALAIREDGGEVQTIEGLSANGELSAVQQAFLDKMGLQCGFCTPGQIMQATALLASNPKPDEAAIRRGMSGNLCKCSAYPNILAAVQAAAAKSSV
jgi:aerobic-type carbon monoxide dehydrogenase small subunit (CoxS/CutS family)